MSDNVYVYSTLAADTNYATWVDGGNGISRIEKNILIKGGSGVANKHLITPLGIATKITKEEAKLLKEHRLFKLHEKNGFVRIREDKVEPEVAVAEDMNSRDNSAPLVPEDFVNDEVKPQSRKSGKK